LPQALLAAMAWAPSEHRAGAGGSASGGPRRPMSQEPFLAWPGWRHLRFAWVLSLAGAAWFAWIYAGADALTAHRAARVRVHFDAELGIPFIPETIVVYMSIYLLFLAAPFIIRERSDFFALCMTLNLVVLVSGFCFLLVPAQLAFPSPK